MEYAGVARSALATPERRGLFVIRSRENAVAQKVCHHVLIPPEETSVIQRAMSANAQHLLQLAVETFTALLDLALVHMSESNTVS